VTSRVKINLLNCTGHLSLMTIKSNKVHWTWYIRVCSYYEAVDKLLQNFVK